MLKASKSEFNFKIYTREKQYELVEMIHDIYLNIQRRKQSSILKQTRVFGFNFAVKKKKKINSKYDFPKSLLRVVSSAHVQQQFHDIVTF